MNQKNILKIIKKSRIFLISTHINPDPDALACEIALFLYLQSLGKKVYVINESHVPKRYAFLPKVKVIQKYQKNRRVNFDTAIIVDCGDLNRVGCVKELINSNHTIINIDHHITNDRFGDYNMVKPHASSTAEVLFELFKEARYKFSRPVAILLYLGIMTDTGSFRYESTTAHTHAIVSQLMKFKLPVTDLYKKLYESIPAMDLRLFMKVVSNFEILYQGKVICLELNKEILNKFSEGFDLRDMIFRFLRSIRGVEIIVILTVYKRNLTRVNFRSQGKCDVAKLAHIFKGGGHKKASGCVIPFSLKQARQRVLDQIRKVL